MPQRPGVSPSASSPRSSTLGARPVATSTRSASASEPSASMTRTPPSEASTRSMPAPSRSAMPSVSNACSTSAAASGSNLGSRRPPRCTTVTSAPSRRWSWASSQPAAPPPRTIRLAGTSCDEVASMVVLAASRILGREISPEQHRALIERSLDEAGQDLRKH